MSPQAVTQRLQSLGIDWMAITDHNSFANCPAYALMAEKAGISFTWGVELQTLEEIHLLVYFDAPGAAQSFGKELYDSLLPLPNDPEFFGDQVIIDEKENILGMEQRALANSSQWDLQTAVDKALEYGGYCVPAHIDAEANSILGQLGFLPREPQFELLGISAKLDLPMFLAQEPALGSKVFLRCSDAHYLSDLGSGSSRLYVQNASVAELSLAARGLEERKIVI